VCFGWRIDLLKEICRVSQEQGLDVGIERRWKRLTCLIILSIYQNLDLNISVHRRNDDSSTFVDGCHEDCGRCADESPRLPFDSTEKTPLLGSTT
jgi:hypothetical protein